MISFDKINDEDTEYRMSFGSGKHIDLFLLPRTTLTNKFEIITSSIQKMSEIIGNTFDEFIYFLLLDYQNCDSDECRYNLLSEYVRTIADFANTFVENNGIDYSEFADESKRGDSSIFFDENEMKKIIKLSEAFKIYSLFSNSETKLSDEYHRKIYNDILSKLDANSSTSKISKLLEVLALQSRKTLWRDYDDLSNYSFNKVMEAFNIITNTQIIVCKYDRNPIPFFIEIFNNIAQYKNKFKEEGINYTDDESQNDRDEKSLYAARVDLDLLKITKKNVLNKMDQISFKYLSDSYNNQTGNISSGKGDNFLKQRLNQIEYVSPIWASIIVPILSKAIDIEYEFLQEQSPKRVAVMSFYIAHQLKPLCNNKFNSLFDLFAFYPKSKVPESTTYRLTNISHFINSTLNLSRDNLISVGGLRIILVRIIENFIGKMKTGTVKYCNILTGQDMKNTDFGQIEVEAIDYLVRYFSDNLETEAQGLEECIHRDLNKL
ncbi:hypothetical protein [Desulfobacula sp.]|uniref:hypothetical protein n=1 Tax=Desulfobacula sp. TaxID=2593537 RepID=UPI001EC4B19A|nr:hypothetical protein [Desulfobacula sp.]